MPGMRWGMPSGKNRKSDNGGMKNRREQRRKKKNVPKQSCKSKRDNANWPVKKPKRGSTSVNKSKPRGDYAKRQSLRSARGRGSRRGSVSSAVVSGISRYIKMVSATSPSP